MQLSATLLPPLASSAPNKAHFSLTCPRHPQEGQSWVGCSDSITTPSVSNISPRALSVHRQVWGHVSLGRPLPWPLLVGTAHPFLGDFPAARSLFVNVFMDPPPSAIPALPQQEPCLRFLTEAEEQTLLKSFHTTAGESLKPETKQTFSPAQLFSQGMDRLTNTRHHGAAR